MRPTIDFWQPKTYGELWAAYEAVWQMLVSQTGTWTGDERGLLMNTIVEVAYDLLSLPSLSESVMATLEQIADDPVTDVAGLVRAIRLALRCPADDPCITVADRLQALDHRLDGHDFPSRLRRFVKCSVREDYYDQNGTRSYRVEAVIQDLAQQAVAEPSRLIPELEWLICDAPPPACWFAFQISRLDAEVKLLETILQAQLHAGERAKPDFLSGYLAGIFQRNRTSWETMILRLADHPEVRRLYAHLVVQSGMTEAVAQRAIELCEQDAFPIEQFQDWWFRPRLRELEEPTFLRLIELHLAKRTHGAWSNAVQCYHQYYCEEGTSRPLPDQATFQILAHPAMVEEPSLNQISYYWSRIAAKFLDTFPSRTWDLLRALLNTCTGQWADLVDLNTTGESILTRIISMDPTQSWACIAESLTDLCCGRAWHIQHWLADGYHHAGWDTFPGLLPLFSTDVLWAWVDADVKNRGYWLASVLPRTMDKTGAGRLTRDFLIRYGTNETVRRALLVNLVHSRGWCGPASEHFRRLRDEARLWLDGETHPAVISWIEEYIECLNGNIRREEIDEERES